MFQHYRLPGRPQDFPANAREYCDIWLHDGSEKSVPLVCFFDGALSEEESRAREEQRIHLPFFQQMLEDLYRFAAAPFNFAVIPNSSSSLEDDGTIGKQLQRISSFLTEEGRKQAKLHLVGYSKGARLCFQNLIQGGFDHEEVASFSSFSGAYLFNPKLLKKEEVMGRLKNLVITLGTGRSCPFFLANYNFHRTLADLGVFHTFHLYQDHYIHSYYPLLICSVSWMLQKEVPEYPAGKGYDEPANYRDIDLGSSKPGAGAEYEN